VAPDSDKAKLTSCLSRILLASQRALVINKHHLAPGQQELQKHLERR